MYELMVMFFCRLITLALDNKKSIFLKQITFHREDQSNLHVALFGPFVGFPQHNFCICQ